MIRQCVLVLGMHRSGTSALAGELCRLGLAGPADPMPPSADNPGGFYESAGIVRLNHDLLAAAGCGWNTTCLIDPERLRAPAERLEAALGAAFPGPDSFVLKDPRLCITLPAWRPVLAQDGSVRALLLLRHPAEVAASLAARNGLGETESAMEWLHHMLEAEFASRHLPRAILFYEDLLRDGRAALARAGAEAGIAWPRDAAAAAMVLDAGARHHHAAPDAARIGQAPIGEMADTAWRLFRDGAPAAPLERLRGQFRHLRHAIFQRK